jgi:ribosomal protein S26
VLYEYGSPFLAILQHKERGQVAIPEAVGISWLYAVTDVCSIEFCVSCVGMVEIVKHAWKQKRLINSFIANPIEIFLF